MEDHKKNKKWGWNHNPSAQAKETDYYQKSEKLEETLYTVHI